MNQENCTIFDAFQQEIPLIVTFIEAVVTWMNRGGLFYIGTGTSGRLDVLDVAECIPTFSTEPEKVQGLIASEMKAMTFLVKGAEDVLDLAREDLKAHKLKREDFVLGIAQVVEYLM